MKSKAFTKEIFSWYNFGALLLFLGLFWMFAPHAVHHAILGAAEEASHIEHIFQGVIAALGGLGLMMLEAKKMKKKISF